MLDDPNNILNINCMDPLGRTALLMAIDNENMEMLELLLENKVTPYTVIRLLAITELVTV